MAKDEKKPKRKGGRRKGSTYPGVGGRKDLWTLLEMDKKLEMVEGWSKQGATVVEMATNLGVSKDLFFKWQRDREDFRNAIRRGRYESNGELLNAAFNQASGYYKEVTEPMKLRNPDGSEEVRMVTYNKFFPANTTMAIFMLKNRLPEHYKDKQEHKHDLTQQVVFIGEDELED